MVKGQLVFGRDNTMTAGDVVLTVLDLIGIVAGLVLMGLGLWGLIEGEKR